MNISYRWLRAIAPSIQDAPARLAERLGMLGAPVDELVDLGADLGDLLIAKVTDVRPHPNADRLRICTVDAGGAPLQVVCGAPNVEAGRMYPFAPVGARLPGGVEIRKAVLRGETSEGMLCSARELGLGKDHAGLMTLAGDWAPGSSFLRELELDDARLVLDVTANRPDLLSHLGVARELASGGVADLRLPDFPGGSAVSLAPTGGTTEAGSGAFRVVIEDSTGCPRYMALAVEGVRVGPSPEWLVARLRAVGLRSINNVVDATNYVLHEVGQPLHAFDLDRLGGAEIRVRRALPGEGLRTLDGTDRVLDETALVIADRERPVALAGIMGGEESEVGDGTTRILIECASFDPRRVRATAKRLGLSTDASHRFERGIDPEGLPRALERVTALVLATAGGQVAGNAVDVDAAPVRRTVVQLRPSKVEQVLGVALPIHEIKDALGPIGFGSDGSEPSLAIEVPSYRPDVTREIDVIEEIARRRGYDSFDAPLSGSRPGTVPTDALLNFVPRVHKLMAEWGMFESRTAAFSPASPTRVPLLNPLSAEESHLRDDLLTGLARRVEHNWRRGVRAVRLYEIGSVFRASGEGGMPAEEVRLAAVFTGHRTPQHWSGDTGACDVWDLKGLAEELSELLGMRVAVADAGVDSTLLDSRESFVLTSGDGSIAGRAGRVRAAAIDAPAWAEALWGFEVGLPETPGVAHIPYAALPEFPPVERDIALLLTTGILAEQVERVIRARAGSLLEDLRPFDQYAGEGLPTGARSVAWRLRFRHPERTLTDAEVDEKMNDVVRGLREELNVERR